MDKVFVAQRVAVKLYATENAVDTAMVEAAELMNEMVKARRELKLSATFGHEATEKLVEAIKALGEARTAMMAVHEEASEAQLRIGVRTRMDTPVKPLAIRKDAPTTLREVG